MKKEVPMITITSTNMGPNATREDHVWWFAYFAARIEAECGFAVHASLAPFDNGQEDSIAGGTEYSREIIMQSRDILWKDYCAGMRVEHLIQNPKGDA